MADQQQQQQKKKVLLLNGPNLNLLGTREPHLYGSVTLADVESRAQAQAASLGAEVACFQSNHEGALVDRIQAARADGTTAVVINAGAYTHTSVAIRDALLGVGIPFVEMHVTNTHKREAFRHASYLSDKAEAVIMGLGTYGYEAAVHYALTGIRAKL